MQLQQKSVNSYEDAVAQEGRLRIRQEQRGALTVGETEHVAMASTGEQLEVDPLRRMSVHEIYKRIAQNFEAKDQAKSQADLAELQAKLGVKVDTILPESPIDDSLDSAMDVDPSMKKLMHQLAEDIYDALERVQKTIAIIKPASIGEKTISRLRHPADANFLVEAGEGEKLYTSLQAQDAEFRVVEKNQYGFVMKNQELGFSAMFIFQDRVTQTGELITPDTTDEEQGDEGTQATASTPTTSVSNPTEN